MEETNPKVEVGQITFFDNKGKQYLTSAYSVAVRLGHIVIIKYHNIPKRDMALRLIFEILDEDTIRIIEEDPAPQTWGLFTRQVTSMNPTETPNSAQP